MSNFSVKYDKDGIDLYFMNHPTPYLNVTESGTVREAFEAIAPSGSTPTGYLLDEILRMLHLETYSIRSITDVFLTLSQVPTSNQWKTRKQRKRK